jgi:hypothetical protein
MFGLEKMVRGLRRASQETPPRRRRAFHGQLDQLEGRQLLTVYAYEVAAAAVGANTAFVLNPGGNLYEHVGTNPNAGWTYLSGGVAQISAGRDSYGQNAVYEVLANGNLDEITSRGTYFLTSGVSQISASQFQSNTVFALMNSGALYEINGTGGTAPRYLAGSVTQISAGRDSAGNTSVFALFSNNTFEEDTTAGWHYIDNGGLMGRAIQISASQIQADTAFVMNGSGGVLEYSISRSLASFRYLMWSGAAEIAAGRDTTGSASVYFLSNTGINRPENLYEITSTSPAFEVAANVSLLNPGSASQYQANTIYAYTTTQYTGYSYTTLDVYIGNSYPYPITSFRQNH